MRPLAAFGDETTALIMYDTASVPVPSAPGAELIRVENGRITQSRFIFDRLPFYLAETAATPVEFAGARSGLVSLPFGSATSQ